MTREVITTMTELDNKIKILAALHARYNDDEDMADFVEYNDLGLPMAYMADEGLVKVEEKGLLYIEETWNLFLQALEMEDMGFESLDQILSIAENKKK